MDLPLRVCAVNWVAFVAHRSRQSVSVISPYSPARLGLKISGVSTPANRTVSRSFQPIITSTVSPSMIWTTVAVRIEPKSAGVGLGAGSGVGVGGGAGVAVRLTSAVISDGVEVGLACFVDVGANSPQAITEARIADKASKIN